ncbi:hypothetical protein M8C21_003667 [Ambrosia artemisiifolia]|uniref:Cytochrome P450 n=1 Tax=Ambrosia artemisiifolia TaxID=4212 RepID=A0AAD5DCN0_AMBAR|nr:hypothetical protein M8C21_003667 [Ambrosia artemisiifolia]
MTHTLLVLKSYVLSSKSHKNLPPSPPKLSLIGNLHQIGSSPHRALHVMAKTYGPHMLIHLGSVPVLVASSTDAAREIMKTHDLIFANRPKLKIARIILYDCQNVAFSRYGECWRQLKSIVDMFGAGTDTTFTNLEWTLGELLRHPQAMSELQQEAQAIGQGKSMIVEDDLDKMFYLKAVLKETLRLHAPWEAPEEFRPERFLNNLVDYKGFHFEFIPRGYPGIQFAMIINEFVLANSVYKFDLALVDEEGLEMSETNGLSVHIQCPIKVSAIPRF